MLHRTYPKGINHIKAAMLTVMALASVFLVGSCATLAPVPKGVESERLLPGNALAYARLDKETLAATMAMLPGSDEKSAAAIAKRTDSMTLAFVSIPGMSMPGSRQTGFIAVASGRYPAGAASFSLSTDSSWRRDGAVWEQKNGSLRLAFADGGRVFLGTVPLTGILKAASEPHSHPIPSSWAQEWAEPIAVYIPDPITLVRERLPIGDGVIPMIAMMLSARPSTDSGYVARLSFEFETERAALVFAPLCRVFLYAAASALWPERSASVTDNAVWVTNGRIVSASGLPLDASALAGFATLAGF